LIRKPWKSLRFKILYLIGLSALASVLTAGFLVLVAIATYKTGFPYLASLLMLLRDEIGIPVVFTSACLVLFIFYLFVLGRPTVRYLMAISQGIERITAGNFDYRLPIWDDELGVLAANINAMTAQLKQSIEEERRAERTKVELVTNVSHDLRTPLTSIVGYLGLIEEDRYRDEVELRHYVRIAYEKTMHLKTMIDDLFEFTRTTSGGMGLRLARIDLVRMLGQLAAQYRLQFEQAEMECLLSLPDHSIFVDADGDKLVRVFENLIVNAIQYGKDGRRIDIAVWSDSGQAVVEFANYGEPLPASVIPLLFERFYRGEQSRSRNTGGSGLGLAIAKNIVELHHGAISAASDQGRTSFTVKLPLAK
jgi:Signal transduction histidine kinase